MTDPVDLRSDTVTRPTPAMRAAIARAEVGDDCLGDDPTVRALEVEVAALLGKEEALFFPSGTMANQTALGLLGRPGAEAVIEQYAHVFHWEEGAAAALWGMQLRGVPSRAGCPDPAAVRAAIRPAGSPFLPRTALLALENTHLASGGSVIPPGEMAATTAAAREAGLAVHLDGARLWNAMAASGDPPHAWAAHADTVMVSLSKALGAPVGAVLALPRALREEAWRIRRRLGGQMRQAGVLAAAGIHALHHHLDRLPEDHRRASEFARGVSGLPGLAVLPPATNVVMIDLATGPEGARRCRVGLERLGVLLTEFGPGRLRAVFHLDVDDAGLARAVSAFGRVVPTLA